jgi:hypothetical protein
VSRAVLIAVAVDLLVLPGDRAVFLLGADGEAEAGELAVVVADDHALTVGREIHAQPRAVVGRRGVGRDLLGRARDEVDFVVAGGDGEEEGGADHRAVPGARQAGTPWRLSTILRFRAV